MSGHAATIICLIGLVSGLIQVRPRTVSVAPFRGPNGKVCARAFAEGLSPAVNVVQWRPQWRWVSLQGVSRGVLHDIIDGELKGYDVLSLWFETHRATGVDVWVMGTVSLGAVIVEVYDGGTGELLRIGKIRPQRDCRLRPEDLERLSSWVLRSSYRARFNSKSTGVR